MKNVLFAVAALAALAVTARPAAAQYPAPAYGPPAYGPVVQAGCTQCDGGSGYGGYSHGWGFGLKDKLFGGHLLGLFGNHGGGRSVTDLPVVDPRTGNAGQLAYPHHLFYRSPRDYFMWDER
jgi:hypothetical protein